MIYGDNGRVNVGQKELVALKKRCGAVNWVWVSGEMCLCRETVQTVFQELDERRKSCLEKKGECTRDEN